jgi:tetratricopeptide (TPR) repeat protein
LRAFRRYQTAVSDFADAIKLKPNFALAYCNRGFSFSKLGEYDRALTDYLAGLEYDNGNKLCHLNRGTLFLMLGQNEKAATDFTAEIDDKPTAALALSRRGRAREALDKTTTLWTTTESPFTTIPGYKAREKAWLGALFRGQRPEQRH